MKTFSQLNALTIGSATIDVIASVDDQDIERMTMHNATSSFLLLEEGRKIDVSSIKSSVGGGGTNSAVALARLGYQTTALVRVGNDLEGKKIQEVLSMEQINTDLMIKDSALPTGQAIMVMSHVRNPTIFTNRGANIAFCEDEIDPALFKGQNLVYIASLSGNSAACLTKIARLAKEAGAFVATNPGIRQITYWSGDIVESLSHIDLLSINAVEAEQLALTLLPKGQAMADTKSSGEGPVLLEKGLGGRTFESFVQEVCKIGPKIVLVTNGAEGAYVGTPDGIRFHPAGKSEVSNTAGAGDAFATTFSAYAAIGADLDICLKAATANALSVIAAPDTQSGLLMKTEINNAMCA
ncbi:carbohydrate kinase family protein [Sneathiella sp. HT1-7]|uniref:carbohydrate kinase family protein n=1 Tax=Sneathiella sp. HT1-7 TaxID=2887192 RepID=UPI001D154DE8|nr:carbohydrate kinase family protein [Sneathiella sp. HT1-7]MCC3303367.1 carbohydrate kinase family protein [Sneathiella sp. HT1-7]